MDASNDREISNKGSNRQQQSRKVEMSQYQPKQGNQQSQSLLCSKKAMVKQRSHQRQGRQQHKDTHQTTSNSGGRQQQKDRKQQKG